MPATSAELLATISALSATLHIHPTVSTAAAFHTHIKSVKSLKRQQRKKCTKTEKNDKALHKMKKHYC